MSTITYHLEQSVCASTQLARERHALLALRAWRRFIRAVKLALALTVLAALLLAATLPVGAQGPTPYIGITTGIYATRQARVIHWYATTPTGTGRRRPGREG